MQDKKLEEKFLVKDLGGLSYYLGIKVVKGQDTTQLLQDAYLQKVLERFNLTEANAVQADARCAGPAAVQRGLS